MLGRRTFPGNAPVTPHPIASPLTARRAGALTGRLRVPGDKSISHRALILGALAVGRTRISGLLEGEDVINTSRAMAALGARVERVRDDADDMIWEVFGVGVGGFRAPAAALDFGNSGTGCRLVMGAVAGCPITATFDGDASLRRRPMNRILDPVALIGARAVAMADGGRLPVTLAGARDPIPIVYRTPVASAQIKSAVLLAALAAPGATTVIESEASRDHTELMLRHFGADVVAVPDGPHGRKITLVGQPELAAASVTVPADPSSAAFPMVAALVAPGSDVVFTGVMTNPLRTGLITTLREMGADIEALETRTDAGEPMADFRVRASSLRGVEVPASRAPSMIDEYPVLAVVAAYAEGITVMRGLKELRVKESDRLATALPSVAACQRRRGRDRGRRSDRPRQGKCARRRARRDPHGPPDRDVGAGDGGRRQASDPGRRCGVHRHQLPGVRRHDAVPGRRSLMIIAIDGPAASGKGTLGKRLAAHYGLRHLDTGLLYRAVAKAVIDAGHRVDDALRAEAAARSLDPATFDEAALKGQVIGEAASVVSAIPEVRAALFGFQQDFAAAPPGAVLDGRDIGTVICPHADVKIFVTASPQERARRRTLEFRRAGATLDEAEILADILRRDARDTQRAVAPLRPAADAHELDTTTLDIAGVLQAAIRRTSSSGRGCRAHRVR